MDDVEVGGSYSELPKCHMTGSGQNMPNGARETLSQKKKRTGTKVSDPRSVGAKGSEGTMGKITITFSEGLSIQNNVDATLKLAGASIFSTPV